MPPSWWCAVVLPRPTDERSAGHCTPTEHETMKVGSVTTWSDRILLAGIAWQGLLQSQSIGAKIAARWWHVVSPFTLV